MRKRRNEIKRRIFTVYFWHCECIHNTQQTYTLCVEWFEFDDDVIPCERNDAAINRNIKTAKHLIIVIIIHM